MQQQPYSSRNNNKAIDAASPNSKTQPHRIILYPPSNVYGQCRFRSNGGRTSGSSRLQFLGV